MVLSSADIFFKISLFIVVVFFSKKNLSGISVVSCSLDRYHSRRALSGSKLFAKVISRRH